MECTGGPDLEPCSIEKHVITMEMAGAMVGLDLTKPIDCSQMQIGYLQVNPSEENHSRLIFVERETVLTAYVFNDYGDREELVITFKLKSQRMPKMPPQK